MCLGDRFCFSRKGRTGQQRWVVHLKGANCMAVSLGSALRDLGLPWVAHFSLHLHERAEKPVLTSCRAPISDSESSE